MTEINVKLFKSVLGCGVVSASLYFRNKQNFADMKESNLATNQGENKVEEGYNLKLVQVVFRHGARTPLTNRYWEGQQWDVCGKLIQYSPTLVRNVDGGAQPQSKDNIRQLNTRLPGGCHKGELTLVGQRQALELGLQLRERYIEKLKFLPYLYEENLVQGRSTNYQRTLATLNGVITGLYPYTNDIPVGVYAAEDVDEILFVNTHKCKRLQTLLNHSYTLQKSRNSNKSFASKKQEVNSSTTFLDEYQELEKSDEHLRQLAREVISEGFGDVDKEKINFVAFYDAVTTLKFHSKPIPQSFVDLCSKKFKGGFDELISLVEKWATEKLVVAISPAMEEVHHKDIMRLSMGLLIWNMVQKMEKIAHGNTSQNEIICKMYLYSGHDTTITPLLMALGQEVQNWPPYVSNIVFELWEKNGQYYVTALFNGDVIVTTNGGGIGGRRIELIPLEEFKRDVIGAYVLTEEEHENECAVVFTHDQSLPKQTPAQQQHQSTIVKN